MMFSSTNNKTQQNTMTSNNTQLNENELYDTCMNLFKQIMENIANNNTDLCNSKKSNEELLQEDQNLADDIKNLLERKRAVEDRIVKYKSEIEDLNKDIDNCNIAVRGCYAQLDDIEAEIEKLNNERTEIHKKWIVANPIKQTKVAVNSLPTHKTYSLRDIFEAFCDIYSEKYTLEAYKRFDNLMHNRCKSSQIFYTQDKFTFDKVLSELNYCHYDDMVKQLEEIHG